MEKKMFPGYGNQNSYTLSQNLFLKTQDYYIMIKWSIHQENLAILVDLKKK
jgi:hypothetical protein